MKPEDQILSYLTTHRTGVAFSTVDAVVEQIKLSVFYGMSPLKDDEIRKVVVKWATIYAVGLLLNTPAGPAADPTAVPPAPTTPDSAFVDAIKKAINSVNDGVTIGRKGANINIGVTGPTANLKSGNKTATLGISWTGTLKLEAAAGPFHAAGSLAKDKWEVTLSFPQDTYIPNLSTLGTVFSEGVDAIGKVADATRSLQSLKDISKVGSLIKPQVAKLQDAVDAASGLAKADKQGGPSFAFKFGSPTPMPGQQGMPGGVQGTVVFTYVF